MILFIWDLGMRAASDVDTDVVDTDVDVDVDTDGSPVLLEVETKVEFKNE
jgi:hypothetical protein